MEGDGLVEKEKVDGVENDEVKDGVGAVLEPFPSGGTEAVDGVVGGGGDKGDGEENGDHADEVGEAKAGFHACQTAELGNKVVA